MSYYPGQKSSSNRRAIAWALFSQTIWLPALILDAEDQLTAQRSDYNFHSVAQIPNQTIPSSLTSRKSESLDPNSQILLSQSQFAKTSTGIVLNAVSADATREIKSEVSDRTKDQFIRSSIAYLPTPRAPHYSVPSYQHDSFEIKPTTLNSQTFMSHSGFPTNDLSRQLYSRSDLLGGTVTLSDLSEPDMPPIARAERARWSRLGDPLAPVPQTWREPMRRALADLSQGYGSPSPKDFKGSSNHLQIDSARIVHVPSSRIRNSTDVPLALQSDGTVDILNQPDDPAVVEEIQRWSAKQKLPLHGRMSPAVIHLHPLPSTTDPHSAEKTTFTPEKQKSAQFLSERSTKTFESSQSSRESAASSNNPVTSQSMIPPAPPASKMLGQEFSPNTVDHHDLKVDSTTNVSTAP